MKILRINLKDGRGFDLKEPNRYDSNFPILAGFQSFFLTARIQRVTQRSRESVSSPSQRIRAINPTG